MPRVIPMEEMDAGAAADALPGIEAHAPAPATTAPVYPPVDWDAPEGNSTNSTTSTRGYKQTAILPPDSILMDWFERRKEVSEAADCFIAGAILPVVGAILARNVWFPWDGKQYPNLFVLLAGKPGDRKSTEINAVERFARRLLPAEAFLPDSFSPETLFDAYEGRSDKLWVAPDANPTLTDWRKESNGVRVASRFLNLYDCRGLSESFRRNIRKGDEDRGPARTVAETSTSIVFGATFNIARFQGQEVRAGMARRFLYYVSEGMGRIVVRPRSRSDAEMDALLELFRLLGELRGEIDFSRGAEKVWHHIQTENRRAMDTADPFDETLLSRLASAPMQTLHVAMIFEATRWARNGGDWDNHREIESETLELADQHVAECLRAAAHLERIANRATAAQDAEILLAHVRRDFKASREDPRTIYCTRSALTYRYARNPGRSGWTPDDLYLRLLPALERMGQTRLVQRRTDTKPEVYGFKVEALTV